MRFKGAIVAFGLALLTSGCYTADGVYLREGVGTSVPTTDIVEVTNIQEMYFGEICRQAGLPLRPGADGLPFCDEAGMPPGAWMVFVQAGMNDMDRRCDAYLAWLDNRRRSREPILKQMHSTAAVTAAIMGLTAASATYIAIVGAAFGFAQETFVNLSGRLITEVNQSTVQSLVLTRQNDYRGGLKGMVIVNKPAALYALRSYLRLCMPMTIETEINVTMTGVDRNGVPPAPMITPRTIAGGIITRAEAPIARVERRREVSIPNRFTDTERSLDAVTIQRMQTALCVSPTGDLGPRGSDTRMAISEYLVGRQRAADELLTPLTRPLVSDAVSQVGSCAAAGFGNAFEVGAFGIPQSARVERIKEFQRFLRDALRKQNSNMQVDESGAFDNRTRTAIAEFRRLTQRTLSGPRNQQLDKALSDQIIP